MKRYLIFIVSVFLIFAAILVGFGYWVFFFQPLGRELLRPLFLIINSVLFLFLIFNLRFKTYFYLFLILLSLGLSAWLYNFVIAFFITDLIKLSHVLWGLIISVSICCIAPFISVVCCYFIQKYESKYINNIMKGKFHLHEGFAGIILICIAAGLYFIRVLLIPYEWKISGLHILATIVFSFITLLPFFGGFLVGRDWDDVKKFRFLTKVTNFNGANENIQNAESSNDFYAEKSKNTHLLGLIISTYAIMIVVFSSDFIPYSIFHIPAEILRIIGWFFFTIGAIVIGYDWIRLKKKFDIKPYIK
jgi:hypothetical protein